MSERKVFDCDGCSLQNIGDGTRVSFVIDRRADGAGGMEAVVEEFDLCGECCRLLLRKTSTMLSQDDSTNIVAAILLRKNKDTP